jgi:hypothetical protein
VTRQRVKMQAVRLQKKLPLSTLPRQRPRSFGNDLMGGREGSRYSGVRVRAMKRKPTIRSPVGDTRKLNGPNGLQNLNRPEKSQGREHHTISSEIGPIPRTQAIQHHRSMEKLALSSIQAAKLDLLLPSYTTLHWTTAPRRSCG